MHGLLYRLAKAEAVADRAIANAKIERDMQAFALLQEAHDYIVNLRVELRRCVQLLDGDCTLPDGSNADTRQAHALLGDFDKESDE